MCTDDLQLAAGLGSTPGSDPVPRRSPRPVPWLAPPLHVPRHMRTPTDRFLPPDRDAYVARAVAAASDLPALAALRETLRERVAASALCDAPGLARCVEDACRTLLRERRSRQDARLAAD